MKVTISNSFVGRQIARLELLENGELVFRECAITLTGVMKRRIFQDGLNADGRPIGTYSPGYIKTRVKKGWSNSDKVILVLTDQMRGDMKPMPAGNASYGIGFSNPHNFDKAEANNERYGAKIFAHTSSEGLVALQIIKRRTNEILNGNG